MSGKSEVYVGRREYKYGRMIMSHMASKDIDALHDMAKALGINQKHFQSNDNHPHYDVCKMNKKLAIDMGAIEVDDRELITKCFK